ncbi:hypothetical protein AB0I53_04055 [Saccharopolyspora sp. NPDC050389]|uniref:hypothetical protein n=1 Tax=Saccharopolyspora sp. NPDC050389 TaxID=3155516 RepID=UPI003404EACE
MSRINRNGFAGNARTTCVGAALLAGSLFLSGCSLFQSTDSACSDVKEVVEALPPTNPDDTGVEIMPRIDQQIAAAREAQGVFADAEVPAEFQDAWTGMIGALEENREAWQAVTPWKGAPGTEMIGVLELGSVKQKADDAKNSLNAAADRHGFASCGTAINWQY